MTTQSGAYLVAFNETVRVPRNYLATVYPRSSLWRPRVGSSAGVVDTGYRSAMGALLEVKNSYGIITYRDDKLGHDSRKEGSGEWTRWYLPILIKKC